MTKLSIKYLPLLLFAMIAVSSCKDKKEGNTEGKEVPEQATTDTAANGVKTITFTADQFKLSDIQTGAVESRNLSSIIKMTGVINAKPGSVASVSAPLGGYIKTSGLLPGQQVRKGQVLATLENPEFISIQQQYLESIGRLEYLDEEYKRQQQLREEDVNATKTFQQVSSDLKVMKAKISGLEQQMALIGISSSALKKSNSISRTANIYAPISGYVKTSNVDIGKYVASTDVLFEIMGTSDLHLALNAFEKDLGKIRIGQSVKFSLSNENKYDRTAKVYLVGQAANDNKMIPVHCRFTQESGLLPGMYVKALLETGTAQQSAVPSEALVQLEGTDYIIVETKQEKGNHTFQLIPVSKGVEQTGYTAIELPSTVDAGQLTVVVKNAYTILSAIRNAEEEE
ncbi:efflux RND transporter periplasmic adaptor subunit [Chitinophaga sp. 212800010-3]|uniref:efflux RND transporter periplasmic adaptor subunit n=1 Tax=Bacteroidota TaxID=976 RepID=UPI001AC88E80|nr:efflux RND transporter periplasmic adaptor subunit [Chitinophaga sp. 212800010-3]MBN8880588.1 efflux RND transporter periplasmic adaptor subunit [Sphingobacteriales bacterium]MBN9484373.1 efflux RND transporter periplasmic adaptor subunit [Bacteroidota bacterium]MEC5143537.1 Efflux RND transporter periplasmic adaptor subunit [Chitinophaga sp. 212800010-3]